MREPPAEPLVVLIVDDNANDRALVRRTVEQSLPGCRVLEANNEARLRESLDRADLGLIVTDYHLSWTDGIRVLRAVKERQPSCPIVMFTATGDEEVAVEAMKAGLDDYVLKSPRHLGRLALALRGALARAEVRRRADVSDRERERLVAALQGAAAERELLLAREREASRIKDEFLTTVSHELRTPLNAILGWAVLLKSSTDASLALLRRGLDTIERNARAQTRIIEDILDASRLIRGQVRIAPEPIDPEPILLDLLDTARPSAQARDITLHFQGCGGRCRLLADPDRLRQIVWNLLSNAVKFTPEGGKVWVSVEPRQGQFLLRVRDSGCGITPSQLPLVFGHFWQADSSTTRAHGGLGLGLAITRHLVELHGGTIEATSEGPGHGATFTVSLPLGSQSKPPPPAPSPPHEQPRREGADRRLLPGARVLVVEDDVDTRELIGLVLTREGATVHAVGTAQQALDALGAFAPDAVVSDIGLPDHDGYWLLDRLRAARPLLPAAAVTAHARNEDAERALAAGFDRHVSKPVDPSHLVDVVAGLLSPPRSEPPR